MGLKNGTKPEMGMCWWKRVKAEIRTIISDNKQKDGTRSCSKQVSVNITVLCPENQT